MTFIHPVKDLEKAKALYGELLGVKPITDQPYYVGFTVAGQDIGLDPMSTARDDRAAGLLAPDDIRGRAAALLDGGARSRRSRMWAGKLMPA
jgi:catechol 2,3-dioxygenase-like lactoylglutathione lyase family enzyme